MKQYVGRVIACALVVVLLLGAGFDFLKYWEMTEPGYESALGELAQANKEV